MLSSTLRTPIIESQICSWYHVVKHNYEICNGCRKRAYDWTTTACTCLSRLCEHTISSLRNDSESYAIELPLDGYHRMKLWSASAMACNDPRFLRPAAHTPIQQAFIVKLLFCPHWLPNKLIVLFLFEVPFKLFWSTYDSFYPVRRHPRSLLLELVLCSTTLRTYQSHIFIFAIYLDWIQHIDDKQI